MQPQPPLLPLQFSSFYPTLDQCHIPQLGFLALSPACAEFVGLQARRSRAKEQLGLPGQVPAVRAFGPRPTPCARSRLCPGAGSCVGAVVHPAGGQATVGGGLAQLGCSGEVWGGTSVGFVTAFPSPFCLGQGRAELPEGPSDQSMSWWLEQCLLPRAVPRSAS